MTNLPPLPNPVHGYYASPMFTADQMHAYARAAMAQAGAEPVACVTECEACFTPDACQLRGTCDHYAASKLRIAPTAQPAPPEDMKVYDAIAANYAAAPLPRMLLEQYDLDQSPDYRKGYEDGRLKGYQVGHRHATERAAPPPDLAMTEARSLAAHMARVFYPEVPQFELCDSLAGVISQIDNMVTGLQRAAPLPAREPLTGDQHIALREAHCIGASDAYFEARPAHDHEVSRLIFEHGFTRGFDSHDRLMMAGITATPADKEQS